MSQSKFSKFTSSFFSGIKPNINPYHWYKKLFRNKKARPYVIVATIIYILAPIDIIPEVLIGVLGPLGLVGLVDDTLLITVFISELLHWLSGKSDDSKK